MLVAKIKRFLGLGLLLALVLGISTNYLWAAEAAGGGGGGGHGAGGGAGDVNPYAALSQVEKDRMLLSAARDGHLEIVRLLLAAGADVNLQTQSGSTALMLAAHDNHVAVVRLLLDAGADVNVQDQIGYSALIWAATRGHVEVVRLLLAAGADVNVQDQSLYSVLMVAARDNHVAVVRLLLDAGADVNLQRPGGDTALMWAAINGHLETVRLLLGAGADINAQTDFSYSALRWAAFSGHLEVIRLLLAAGADIPAADRLLVGQNARIQTALAELVARKTEFLAAAEAGNLAQINELIDLPIRGDRKLVINQALLALAGSEANISAADFERILAILLAHGADIEFRDTIESGGFREAKGAAAASISAASDTALELAIMTNVPNRVDALLMAGANPELLSNSVLDALAVADKADVGDIALKENQIIIHKMIENANLARAMLISPTIFKRFTLNIGPDQDNTLDPVLRYLFQWEKQENDRAKRRMLATPLPPDED